MLTPRGIRSIMFTPALRMDRFYKTIQSEADLALLDCEDSVGMNNKAEARNNLCAYLKQKTAVSKSLAVRINAVGTDDGLADLLALRNSKQLPDYIIIPKVETRADVIHVVNMLNCSARSIKIIALIETIKGVQNVEEIAAASDMGALMFGAADYTRSIEGEICWDTLLFPRAMIIHAACKNNIGAIDTPYFDISDINGLREDSVKVKKLGFTGRCAIHPSQIPIINEVFSYSTSRIEQAKRIVTAARESKGNICQVDGKMVGAPIIKQAFNILKLSNLSEFDESILEK